MRHRGWSRGEDVGILPRIGGVLLFILFLPVMVAGGLLMLALGLIMLPFMLIARLLGFRPPDGPPHGGGRHGWGCHGRRHGGKDRVEGVGDADPAASV